MEYVQGDTEVEMLIHNMNEHNGVGITVIPIGLSQNLHSKNTMELSSLIK